MGSMTGRSCIVTGGAQGIGRAIGEALPEEGGDVCFADLNGTKAAEAAAANEARAADGGGKVMSAEVDVTERDQVKAMIARTVETFGKLDVKFNNAGVNKPARARSWPVPPTVQALSASTRTSTSPPLQAAPSPTPNIL